VSKLLLLLLSIPDFSIVLVHPPKYPLTTVLPLVASFGQAHLYHHSHSHLVHYHRQVIGKHWPTHFQSLHPNYKPSQAIACSTLLGSSPPTPPGQRWPRLLPGPFITVSHNLSPPYIFGSWPFSTSNYLSSLPQVKCCTRLPLNLKPSFTIPYISNPGTPCALPWNPLRYFSNTLRPLDLLDQ
jgi:hypothetical protein